MAIEDISNNSKQPSLLLLMLPGNKFIILVCWPTGSISNVVVPLTAELHQRCNVARNEIKEFERTIDSYKHESNKPILLTMKSH